ncbi:MULTISPECIES: cell division protein ZapE [Prauserella salsuginis group]|uniref:Cell division protein ZapE n=1 Tax=Prauserella salsuginis TaxID=387889 RepID=A0ABW6G3X6_9PSEU|nr:MULTISPECIES: cell division protein ZapE [Prauserella salsuginis group]MCR3718384.1 cell division protein ZapE [Prauserella flava]MCR3732954.1 cell division protein ZapE [Prauserella salsuginis]
MAVEKLTERRPEIGADELITTLVPPPRFDDVRLSTYIPNPDEPSQAAAITDCGAFAERVGAAGAKRSGLRGLFGRRGSGGDAGDGKLGLYLDGGFGVGKTHLLASIWHAVPGPKSYGTFVELTHVVGALGFGEAVRRLSEHRLLAIDEFELDDPGDTMLVGRLLKELTAAGVFVAATSNTLPDKLGEGRFAAEDFLREIQALSAKFGVVRVDGPDYRHRGLPEPPAALSEDTLLASAEQRPGSTLDDFDALCEHLASLHPSAYGRLVDGVPAVHIRGIRAADDQAIALRLVALADRLYDRAIPVLVSGGSLDALFTPEMLAGGYRKKYLRAVSRLTALARDAEASAPVSHG